MGDSVPPSEMRLTFGPIVRDLRVTPELHSAMEAFVRDLRPVVGAQAGVATWTGALWALLLERYADGPRRVVLEARGLPGRPSRRWGHGRAVVEARWGAWALRVASCDAGGCPRASSVHDSLESCRRIRVRLAAPVSRRVDAWFGEIALASAAQCEFSLLSRGMWRQLLRVAPLDADELRREIGHPPGRTTPLQCLRALLPVRPELESNAASATGQRRGSPPWIPTRKIRAALPMALRARRLPAVLRPDPTRAHGSGGPEEPR
jgi:hypothetical protein